MVIGKAFAPFKKPNLMPYLVAMNTDADALEIERSQSKPKILRRDKERENICANLNSIKFPMKLKLMNGKHLANETFEFKVNQFPDSFSFRYSTNQWKRVKRERNEKTHQTV